MATKNELIEKIEAYPEAPSTEGLNHEELTDLERSLREGAEEAPAAPAAVETKTIYAVKAGKSITTRSRGILGEGEVITPADLGGGMAALDALIEAGYIEQIAL
ncbi:MAG: hypothetical protein GY767_22685 [Shimia sp.]|nr:hypothetical protein [Shimia sp.]